MRIKREDIKPSLGSSFKLLLTPRLNDYFFWHFHPEYEIVYVEGAHGTRHVGDHISSYENSDLVFIGPNIPHLNFDYGVRTDCEQVIIQMKENFLGKDFMDIPELDSIKQLFKKSERGLSFSGKTKEVIGEKLKQMQFLRHFEQLMLLLEVFQIMAHSDEVEVLNSRAAGKKTLEKEQERMGKVYQYIETNYLHDPNVQTIASQLHLSVAAFCRFFRKNTSMTFTDFVNQYKINQAKNYLLQDRTISETCFAVGFDSLSYFNKLFKKTVGENPSQFRKRFQAA